MDRAMVFTKSGYGFSGYLSEIVIGLEDDTLVLSSAKQNEKILVGDLSKIIVLPRNKQGNLFLAGALAGTYAANLLLGRSDQQSSGFLTENFSSVGAVILTTALGVGVWGTVGLLVNSGTDTDLILDFNQIESEKRNARMKLYDLISEESMVRKIHFSLQGGHVYARVKNKFLSLIGGSSDGYYGGDESDFNLLRRIQMTYSTEPDIEIGAAVQWSSEPSVSAYTYNYFYTYDSYGQSIYNSNTKYYEQTFHVTGYYGIGKYKPFFKELPRMVDIAIGCGIGIANIEYKRGVNIYQYYYQQSGQYQKELNMSELSAVVFGEFNIYLKEYLTLGIAADYVYFPPLIIPSDPLSNLPEQTLSGNACVGFIMGVHL